MKDPTIFERINELAAEEEALYARAGDGAGLDGAERSRLETINVELDQCYDLLRQRPARRSAGLDPDEAAIPPPEVVEHYQPVTRPRRPDAPTSARYGQDLEAERRGWYELSDLVRSLTPDECLVPGYYRDPDWSVRDAVAHIGTWLAEAEVQLERIAAGTYEGHAIDVDALNATFLEAMRAQPWTVAWVQANAGRTRMLQEWFGRPAVDDDEAAWWIRKSGTEHYGEHLPRLREWVGELRDRRTWHHG